MDLIDMLDLIGADDMKSELEEAEEKVTEKEETVAQLKQQIREDLSEEHRARNRGDMKAASRFAGLAERRETSLRREKEELRECRADRDAVERRIRGVLLEALERAEG
jgi:hypothetical protein